MVVSLSVTRPQSSTVPPGQKATPMYIPLFCKAVARKSAAVHPCHAGSSNPQAFRVDASWSNSRWWPGLEWHRGRTCRHQRPLRMQQGALQLPARDSPPFAAPCSCETGSAPKRKEMTLAYAVNQGCNTSYPAQLRIPLSFAQAELLILCFAVRSRLHPQAPSAHHSMKASLSATACAGAIGCS